MDVLRPQVDQILLSDDASSCLHDPLLRELARISQVTVIRHASNAGIARGLNDGFRLAQSVRARWLLTVDQDSSLGAEHVSALLGDAGSRTEAGVRVGAIGVETIEDRSGTLLYPTRMSAGGAVTEELIQAGTLWAVDALTEVGGFDERMGMDAVDAGACLRLRERGYSVCVSPGTSIRHEIGSARVVTFLGRNIMVTGHSPDRRTSMVRNRLRLFPAEFRQSPQHAFRTLRRVTANQLVGLALEPDRWSKARAALTGLIPDRSSAR